jgi:pyrroloquinoline quinone (PQQ) biosynthesis protein C
LLDHYGFNEGPATEYFQLHSELDKNHAALAQSALAGMLTSTDLFKLLGQAEAVHRAYWEMLDALEEARSA